MGGETFAEVFEQALGNAAGRADWTPEPESTLESAILGARAASAAPLAVGASIPGWAARCYAGPAPRPQRALGPAERHAFDELVGLGAALRDDFTVAELRSAFRQLAHRFHPDRLQTQSAADQAHAARIFAFIVGHYQCLKLGIMTSGVFS